MFAELAGAEHGDADGEARGMPAVDSTKGLWQALTSVYPPTLHQTESADRGQHLRSQLHLSEHSVLEWPWKLVTGTQVYSKHQGRSSTKGKNVDKRQKRRQKTQDKT
jgi:hypothetical protein